MKQACSLESMVDAVLSEMKRRGNAKNTIERHERAYSQFYEYALTQGENSYSKVLARSFLEEKEKLSAYRGPRFMEQYRIALNKLDDINGFLQYRISGGSNGLEERRVLKSLDDYLIQSGMVKKKLDGIIVDAWINSLNVGGNTKAHC